MTEQEFENIFRDYFSILANIAYSVVRDEDTSKDMVQQVFLKLWQKRDSLQIQGKIKSYLHRAVVNTCLNYIEKNKKLSLLEDTSEKMNTCEDDSSGNIPDEAIEKEVRLAVDSLPDKCRIVFSLSRFSDMKNREIAEYLDISIKSVEKHIGKALKQLKVTLKPLYDSMHSILFIFLFTILEVGYLCLILSLY